MTPENSRVAEQELKKELVNNRKYDSLSSVDEVMAQQSMWVLEWDWSIIQLFTLFFFFFPFHTPLSCFAFLSQECRKGKQTDVTVYFCQWDGEVLH